MLRIVPGILCNTIKILIIEDDGETRVLSRQV